MQNDISQLIECIMVENQVIAELIDSTARKKQAVILGDLTELSGIMRQESHLLQALEKAETGRQAESLALAQSLGIKEELTASSLVARLAEREAPDTARLAEAISELAINLDCLRGLNRNNKVLLEQSLAFVENMEALLTRQRETTYSAGGSVKDSPTRSVLDKRV